MDFRNQFIMLLEATREDVKKYYPQIEDKDYNAILDADTTGTKERVGNLSRLVLDLFKKDKEHFKLKDSDFMHDVYSAFDNIQKKKSNLTGTEFEKYKNLNSIESIEKLLDINNYLVVNASKKIKLKANEGENYEVFFENNAWEVLIPLDYKTSVALGRKCDASWCTASSSAETWFNNYNKQDHLYIFRNKKNNKAYQYHSRIASGSAKPEFNDNSNKPINIDEFAKENNLTDVFEKIREKTGIVVQDKLEALTAKDFSETDYESVSPIIKALQNKVVVPSQKVIDRFNEIAMSLKKLNIMFLRTTYHWLTKASKKHILSFFTVDFGKNVKVEVDEKKPMKSWYDYHRIRVTFPDEAARLIYFAEELDCKPLAAKIANSIWKNIRKGLEATTGYYHHETDYEFQINIPRLNFCSPDNKDRRAVLAHFGEMYRTLNSHEKTKEINALSGDKDKFRQAIEQHSKDIAHIIELIGKLGVEPKSEKDLR